MCFRNGIQYACPSYHVLLNTIEPFTLCVLAQHCPISRQCVDIVDRYEKSDDWCADCYMYENRGEHVMRESQIPWSSRLLSANMRLKKGKAIRTDSWRDDVPQ
jgi:hypothetical protein